MIVLNFGNVDMTLALLIAGYEQSFIETRGGRLNLGRLLGRPEPPRFQQAMHWRMLFGLLTFASAGLLAWDLLTLGVGETWKALVIEEH